MDRIEIIENETSMEELKSIPNDILDDSNFHPSTPYERNSFLTSLILSGATLLTPGEIDASQNFDFHHSNNNEIKITRLYNKSINDGLVKYIDNINIISKRNITKKSLLKDILSFKALSESWDGYGAIPLGVECAVNSIQLFDLVGEELFCGLTDFHPNPNGTISFEWQNKENEVVSLEVGKNSFSYFVEMSSINVKFFNNRLINAEEASILSEYIQAI